jgi:hypothetical protein
MAEISLHSVNGSQVGQVLIKTCLDISNENGFTGKDDERLAGLPDGLISNQKSQFG